MSTDSFRELRRGPTRVPLFFQKHGFHWSTMCAQSRRVSVYLSAFAFLSDVFTVFCLAFVLFLRLGRGICWQFSTTPFLLFFLSFLRVCHVYSFCSIFPISFHFSSSAFIVNSFLLRICVDLWPLLLISLSVSGGFLVEEVFLLCFHFCTGCQCVRMCF